MRIVVGLVGGDVGESRSDEKSAETVNELAERKSLACRWFGSCDDESGDRAEDESTRSR